MGYSPQNILDSIVTYHDSSNWVMVFDHTLKLMFPPAEFKGRTGSTTALKLSPVSSFQNLYVLWNTPSDNKHGIKLYQITANGIMKFVKEFTEFPIDNSRSKQLLIKFKKDYKLVFPLKNGDIYLFDTSFRKFDVIKLDKQISHLQSMDVDLDGQSEFLVFNQVLKTLTIYRDDFSHPSMVNIEYAGLGFITFSYKNVKNKPHLISLSTGNLWYLLSYKKNPIWYARPVIWAAIWLAVFLFTILIRRIQRIQDEKRCATEKKITELQMKIVRNQMDPHFILNAINAVVDAINREEKEEARNNLLHFAKMYRSLVLSADKIKRPLAEELDFTRNYLSLEQFRFSNRFTYKIEIDPGVDLVWEVPKMVIQSPVENALKHGLLKRESGGEVIIHAFRDDHNLIFEITDNGTGVYKLQNLKNHLPERGCRLWSSSLIFTTKSQGLKLFRRLPT